ncbi:MAG: hypothetical protein ACLVB5_00140 [Christensenellales bacterium]
MTKRIWAGLLALGMALTALPFGIYAEETAWEEEANASEETLDGGLDESAEEFADGLPDYIPEPETDVVDGAADDESADALPEQEESLTKEAMLDLPDFIPEEELPALEEEEPQDVQAGDFVRVTPNTRVYLEIDETAGDDDDGELYDGNFVNEANVYVEQARQDAQGRTWLLVRYLYGAEEPNGEMAWTDTATVWVLAEETRLSDAADYDVTDYAFPYPPAALYAASDFNLRDYNAGVQTFYPGQQNLYGSSGHDSEYKQIAKLDGYGTIYATPHYLEGQTVYCLEHTMNSPGTRNNASGPFEVVDLDGYAVKPGYSGDIYGSRTMHAIGWVLRHTYPYMIVDTGYEDSDVWSRVAGQFAMGTDVYGNLTRIENALANMPQKLEKAEERIAELERQTEQARAELGKPFAQEKELEAKAARLAELNAALNIDEKRKEPMEKRPMKDVLKAYQERADAQSQGEKGGTNEWNR